ncbi:MAG: Arylsulfatase [candidate division BRC1 bacterium ADurb.BinA364]|nr:MAG: Arylsulfatase [candidate division BRC1 bacterium ADurb.BinA364]
MKLASIFPCLFAAAFSATAQAEPAAPRPNIILIMADDMGYSDLGCYGGEIRTPNLDNLARRGIQFTQFYNNAKCAPTRASLLTGLYSQQTGSNVLRNCATIAEALGPAGYNCYMAGKWHQQQLPTDRGFLRYFGLADGACNYFNPGAQRPGEPVPGRKSPGEMRRWSIDGQEIHGYTPDDPNFYTTDAFTDYAISYLEDSQTPEKAGKPFFLYLAYTAPHYPLQAPEEDIARYRGKYMIGWDELRAQRRARQVEMGLIDPAWAFPDRDEKSMPWSQADDKEEWDLKMAVYAAMVDRMDQNIGRLLARLRELGQEQNTLIFFLADNGGCAENVNRTPDIPPGTLASYRTVDLPWANASNTPFRKFKSWNHEGGISTPLIACWPDGIEPGGQTDQVGHIIDIMPTCLELAGAEYPAEMNGEAVLPIEGKSLAPVLRGEIREGHEWLFWQHGESRAARQGQWKLVGYGAQAWELYDMKADRGETNNLASADPDRTEAMARKWFEWAKRCNLSKKTVEMVPTPGASRSGEIAN